MKIKIKNYIKKKSIINLLFNQKVIKIKIKIKVILMITTLTTLN